MLGSKIGIHTIFNAEAVFKYIRRAVAQGTPIPVFKAVGGVGMLEEVKRISPTTITVGRRAWSGEHVEGVDREMSAAEVEGWALIIVDDASEVLNANGDYIDIYEFINEPAPETELGFFNLGRIMLKCVEIARARHPAVRWGIGSFNAGEPEWGEMVAFLDSGVLDGAPEDVILCVHEAIFDEQGNPDPDLPVDLWHGDLIPGALGVPEGGGALIGRVAYWEMAAGADMVPALVSEVVAGWDYANPQDQALRLQWVDQLYSQMWYVMACLPFTLGPIDDWVAQDYTAAYPYLLDYALEIADRQNALPPGTDWRLLLWQESVRVQMERGIALNPAAGLLHLGMERTDLPVAVLGENYWVRPDIGRKYVYQVFEVPDRPQATRTLWTAMVPGPGEGWAFEKITRAVEDGGLADGFDAPIGTAEERRAATLWPGAWFDANPYGSYYLVRDGHYAYHTGADLNLNAPVWDSDRGKPVYAAADGEVTFAGELVNWGEIIVIRHATSEGYVYTRYSAVGDVRVAIADWVHRGEQIAIVDQHNPGEAFHLHFDVSTTEVLADKPGDWPGTDRTRLERDYVNPKAFIEAHRPVGDLPPPPTSVTTVEFGVHNLDGAEWMLQEGIQGWSLHTTALFTGSQALDMTRFADAGIKMLVRLNYAYYPHGNLPAYGSSDYDAFIRACIATIHNGRGVWGWIIGNETNNPAEWPNGQPITAVDYVRAYNRIWPQVSQSIRVGVQGVDPYYGPGSDNREYWRTILAGVQGADFLTVHAKTQDSNPDNVDSDAKFSDDPLRWQYLHLRAYKPLLEAVPERFRGLPVIATEVNPQRHNDMVTLGWQTDQGPEWVHRAAAHFRRYNETALQPVQGIVFYRYSADDWALNDKQAILTAIKDVARM